MMKIAYGNHPLRTALIRRFCLALVFLLAPACTAATTMNWLSPQNSIKQSSGVNAPYTWIAQLVWSPDNLPSPPGGVNPFGVSEGEVELAIGPLNIPISPATGLDGRIIRNPPLVFGNEYAGGFVYTRVYNLPFAELGLRSPTLWGVSGVSGPLLVTTLDPATILAHRPTVTVGTTVAAPLTGFLALYGNGRFIENGDLLPEANDHTSFGFTYQSGSPLSRTFHLLNVGLSPLDIDAIQVPVGYTLASFTPVTLPAGQSVSITLQAQTETTGNGNQTVVVTSDNGTPQSFSFAIATDVRERLELTPIRIGAELQGLEWPVGEPVAWRLIGSLALGPGASWFTPAGTTAQVNGHWRFVPTPGQPLPAYLRLVTP